MSADTTANVAAILAGHGIPDPDRLAARVTAEVLYETAASLRVHAARERAAKAHNDTDHAYWDGVGQAANLLHRTVIDSERTHT